MPLFALHLLYIPTFYQNNGLYARISHINYTFKRICGIYQCYFNFSLRQKHAPLHKQVVFIIRKQEIYSNIVQVSSGATTCCTVRSSDIFLTRNIINQARVESTVLLNNTDLHASITFGFSPDTEQLYHNFTYNYVVFCTCRVMQVGCIGAVDLIMNVM